MKIYAVTGDAFARLEDADGGFVAKLGLAGSGAQCLATDGERIFVGTRGRGLWRSDDEGGSWVDLALPQPDVFSVAVSAVDGAVYAGCEPSALYRSDDGRATWRELDALRHIPSAPTWSFPPRPWTSHVRAIAPSPHEPGLLLVGIELGGLMRSGDGGASWEDHRPGAARDVHALSWHPRTAGRAYEAGGDGAARSADGGEHWQRADAGLDRGYTWALAVDPEEPDSWFISASPGPFQAHGSGPADASVYRWDSDAWQRLEGGLPQPLDSMVYALAFAGERLFAGLRDGRLYASPDRGETWSEVPISGEPLSQVLALAVAG